MRDTISIQKFRAAIQSLASDKPSNNPAVWYRTQKEHWLGWLKEYNGPGAYGRQTGRRRDARYAYNHIVNPQMLMWLIEASKVPKELVAAARQAAADGATMMQQSGAIRRHVPWEVVQLTLWPVKERRSAPGERSSSTKRP